MYLFVGQRNGLILFRHHSLIKFLIIIFILATISEVVQLWVPARAFNPMDWVANMGGVMLGLVVMYLFRAKKKVVVSE
jgi:VanZ family protein